MEFYRIQYSVERLPCSRSGNLLNSLEAFHGRQQPDWPTDPYQFLIWWHCGYPASDAACAKGWASLTSQFEIDPQSILVAAPSDLAAALKPGGMVPELRAERMKEIAERVQKEFAGDLDDALRHLPIAKARTALKKFPGIANPGADRILLFAGLAPVPAVPSNCPMFCSESIADTNRTTTPRRTPKRKK